jgi:hypothetical protein
VWFSKRQKARAPSLSEPNHEQAIGRALRRPPHWIEAFPGEADTGSNFGYDVAVQNMEEREASMTDNIIPFPRPALPSCSRAEAIRLALLYLSRPLPEDSLNRERELILREFMLEPLIKSGDLNVAGEPMRRSGAIPR